jgi:hypothetical protein
MASKRSRRTRGRARGPVRPARPSPAERRLLALAGAVAESARHVGDPREAWLAAVGTLITAHADDDRGPAGQRPVQRRATDKTRRLALAWAREQVRLAILEVLQRAAAAGVVRGDIGPDTLAWLVLVGTEALRQEPREAAADHARTLVELTLRDVRVGRALPR